MLRASIAMLHEHPVDGIAAQVTADPRIRAKHPIGVVSEILTKPSVDRHPESLLRSPNGVAPLKIGNTEADNSNVPE